VVVDALLRFYGSRSVSLLRPLVAPPAELTADPNRPTSPPAARPAARIPEPAELDMARE